VICFDPWRVLPLPLWVVPSLPLTPPTPLTLAPKDPVIVSVPRGRHPREPARKMLHNKSRQFWILIHKKDKKKWIWEDGLLLRITWHRLVQRVWNTRFVLLCLPFFSTVVVAVVVVVDPFGGRALDLLFMK